MRSKPGEETREFVFLGDKYWQGQVERRGAYQDWLDANADEDGVLDRRRNWSKARTVSSLYDLSDHNKEAPARTNYPPSGKPGAASDQEQPAS